MREADVLVLIINNTNNGKGIIPGKLFEYIASQKSVLAIGRGDGDSAKLIRETNAGDVFEFDDEKGIGEFISNVINSSSNTDAEKASFYTRENQAKVYSEIIEKAF